MRDVSTVRMWIWVVCAFVLASPVHGEIETAEDGDAKDSQPSDPSDPIGGRDHWAFRPLRSAVPSVAAHRGSSPIDAFVLTRLKTAKLTSAPPADRRTLVRRVYFQLVGLPPTPKQAKAFIEDQRPDAYERLLDRLLSSPHFGERWGRHWLDLARYADSNGLDENYLFREAWRYRNWVIDAFNADLPFDKFVAEQIAGDLLPHGSIAQRDRQRIGAGFLVLGPKVLIGNDSRQRRMDVVDEQLDTIGRAILGQTIGCARCHDHKFDPIPTKDYYALAGIMTSTSVMETRSVNGGSQYLMEQLIGLGPNGDEADESYERYWRERPKRQTKLKQAKSALELLEKGDTTAFEALRAKNPGAIADDANESSDSTQDIDKRIAAQKQFVADLVEADKAPEIPPRAMIPCDVVAPADEFIRLSGQFDRLGQKVKRGFPRVLSKSPVEIAPGSSGRLELARWLTDTKYGAGHLAARVLANRVWYHMIGRGLVRSVDNFGRTGDDPTHPELLDYLAGELIDSNWSIKQLVRLIALSRTFRMSSRGDKAAHSVDPDNRLLWRAHRRRLSPESMRDAMLLISGELDRTPMDSSVWYLGDQATSAGANKNRRRTDFPCRSVYLPVIRNDLPELFDSFDFADPHAATGMRQDTMNPTQTLFILNDDSVMAAALAIAQRLLATHSPSRPESIADEMFEHLFSESASDQERTELVEFVHDIAERLTGQRESDDATLKAWSIACHALLASSRFQLLE